MSFLWFKFYAFVFGPFMKACDFCLGDGVKIVYFGVEGCKCCIICIHGVITVCCGGGGDISSVVVPDGGGKYGSMRYSCVKVYWFADCLSYFDLKSLVLKVCS